MSEDPPGPARARRPKLIVGLIVAGLGATIALTIALSRSDPEPAAHTPVATTQPNGRLPGAAAEMVRLLDAGSMLAYDGRYTAIRDGGGAVSTLRLWQKSPKVRLDTETGAGAEMRRSAQFALPSGPVSCVRDTAGVWSCKSEPGLRLRSGLVPEEMLSQLSRFAVEARTERIGDVDARCFALAAASTRADVCVTPEGVPVRVIANSIRVELAQLDRSPPPDEIFELPAALS